MIRHIWFCLLLHGISVAPHSRYDKDEGFDGQFGMFRMFMNGSAMTSYTNFKYDPVQNFSIKIFTNVSFQNKSEAIELHIYYEEERIMTKEDEDKIFLVIKGILKSTKRKLILYRKEPDDSLYMENSTEVTFKPANETNIVPDMYEFTLVTLVLPQMITFIIRGIEPDFGFFAQITTGLYILSANVKNFSYVLYNGPGTSSVATDMSNTTRILFDYSYGDLRAGTGIGGKVYGDDEINKPVIRELARNQLKYLRGMNFQLPSTPKRTTTTTTTTKMVPKETTSKKPGEPEKTSPEGRPSPPAGRPPPPPPPPPPDEEAVAEAQTAISTNVRIEMWLVTVQFIVLQIIFQQVC